MKSPASGTWMRSQMCKRVSCYPRALILRRRWLSEHVSCFSALLSLPLIITTMHSRTRSAATCMAFGEFLSAILPGCVAATVSAVGWPDGSTQTPGSFFVITFYLWRDRFPPNLISLPATAEFWEQPCNPHNPFEVSRRQRCHPLPMQWRLNVVSQM